MSEENSNELQILPRYSTLQQCCVLEQSVKRTTFKITSIRSYTVLKQELHRYLYLKFKQEVPAVRLKKKKKVLIRDKLLS